MHSITCRNRHCPKCQGSAARQWLVAREAELLPVAYYLVVFTLRLTPDEFIRRFLLHVLPTRFHRIRHFGLFAHHQRALTVQQIRSLLVEDTALPEKARNGSDGHDTPRHPYRCPACGAPMRVIEIFGRGHTPRAPPT